MRLAGLAAREASEDDRAAERAHLERALAHDPASAPALDGLAEIARARGDSARLVELLSHRINQLEGNARTPVLLEAGALLAGPLGRPEDAVGPLEEAARLEGEGGAAETALAELYVAAGRAADARPILERLRARAQRDLKGRVAGQLAEKLGQACEALGDADAALAAYEDSFRVDPTRATTQVGLGRLYVGRADWDKALRVYRGMLLGALDPTRGLSKADVYLALGKIHAAQGERQKARGMLERGLESEPAHAGLKTALAELA